MALEKADLTTINKYVRDVVNRIPPRPIKAHTIGTLTSEQINVSAPPVVGGVQQPKITTRALSLGPPPNPQDGDIWIARYDSVGGAWMFQYDASDSTYPWYFIGGTPTEVSVTVGTASSLNAGTQIGTTGYYTIGSLAYTIPRSGDWYFEGHGGFQDSTANDWVNLTVYHGTAIGSTAQNPIVQTIAWNAALHIQERISGLSSGTVTGLAAQASNLTNTKWQGYSSLLIRPIRIS